MIIQFFSSSTKKFCLAKIEKKERKDSQTELITKIDF